MVNWEDKLFSIFVSMLRDMKNNYSDFRKELKEAGVSVGFLALCEDTFVIALVKDGLLASTWTVRGAEEFAIETAKALAVKLRLDIERHGLAVERMLCIRNNRELVRNSERIWTWTPDTPEGRVCHESDAGFAHTCTSCPTPGAPQ